MGNTAHILGALIMGILVSLQPPINAAMARTLGSSVLAGLLSIAISLVLVLFIWLAWGRGEGDLTQVSALPWWVYIGGIVGAIFVVGSIVSAPVLGVALFFVCVVKSRLMSSRVKSRVIKLHSVQNFRNCDESRCSGSFLSPYSSE